MFLEKGRKMKQMKQLSNERCIWQLKDKIKALEKEIADQNEELMNKDVIISQLETEIDLLESKIHIYEECYNDS